MRRVVDPSKRHTLFLPDWTHTVKTITYHKWERFRSTTELWTNTRYPSLVHIMNQNVLESWTMNGHKWFELELLRERWWLFSKYYTPITSVNQHSTWSKNDTKGDLTLLKRYSNIGLIIICRLFLGLGQACKNKSRDSPVVWPRWDWVPYQDCSESSHPARHLSEGGIRHQVTW